MKQAEKHLYVLTDRKMWLSSYRMTENQAIIASAAIAKKTNGLLFWTRSPEEGKRPVNKLMKIKVGFIPNRIVTDAAGNARQPERTDHIAIVFRRSDDWTLAAPAKYEKIACRMWRGYWTHFHRPGDTQWQPIEEYQQ